MIGLRAERKRDSERENERKELPSSRGAAYSTLTEKEGAEACSGALGGVVQVVVDDCNGPDGAAEVGLRANLTLIREMVAKVQLLENARVVRVDPGPRVFLDDVLAGRDHVQLEPLRVPAEHLRGALYDGDASPRGALEEVRGAEEHPHLAVRLLPIPTPHLMKVIAFEILRRQLRPVGAVVEGAQLEHESPENFVHVHGHHRPLPRVGRSRGPPHRCRR